MDLNDKRNKIDAIDDEITLLYAKRMLLVKEIATEKAKAKANVLDESREKSILNRVTKLVPADIKLYLKQVFDAMLDTSKAYQSKYLHLDSNLGLAIKKELEKPRLAFPSHAIVACQGVQGAYSNIAAEKLFKLSEITYFKSFEGVFNAVESGLCSYGVLPIENSSVGSVNAVYDLMKKHRFFIVRSVKLPIRHCLLAAKGVKKEDIKEIISHEQALNQCENYIKTNYKNAKITVVDNTAVAAQAVLFSERCDIAAISSSLSGELYGLAILDANIQDNDNNYTRFICISKNMEIFKNANKISIMVNLLHQAGSLNKLLSKFTTNGLNLTKLESRPLPNTNFEFLFYFDFEGDIETEEVINLLSELDNRTEQLTFLGSYLEV